MKALLKIVAAATALVFVLVLAAVVFVPLIFDPNDHKDEIAALAKERTGRDLTIQGDIGLSVFPWVGIELGVVELGNAAGFKAAYFARTERVSVRLKLLPLLSRRVEMDTVTIDGLALNLERRADGSKNYDDLGGDDIERDSRTGGSQEGAGLAAFALGGLDVNNASLNWVDAVSGKSYSISNLIVSTGAVSPGSPVALEVGFDVAGGKPTVSGRVTLSGTLVADVAAMAHELRELALAVDLKGEQFPNGVLAATMNGSLDADLGKDTAAVRNLKLTVGDLVLTGSVSLVGISKDLSYQGKFEVPDFDVKQFMSSLGQPPFETADESVLTRAAASLSVKGAAGRVAISPLALSLDESKITGRVEITDFERAALRFDLALDSINVDRYLPPPGEQGRPVATPGGAASESTEISVDMLRGLDVAGTARIGALTVSNLQLARVVATVNAKDGLIRMHPLGAELYQGVYAGNVRLDARGKVPSLSVSESLKGVQAGPLLKDLQGVGHLTGTGAVTAKLSARGRGVAAMKETLNGRVRFDFTDGAFKGINVNQMIRDAYARMTGGQASSSGPEQTDFTSLGGTIDPKDGLATNTDPLAKSPFLRIAGKGQAHLAEETIDYRVTAAVVASSVGQGSQNIKDLAGLDIPIRVGGTFAGPSYGLDVQALAGALAKSKAANLIAGKKGALTEKAAGAVGGALGGVIGGALKGLLGN